MRLCWYSHVKLSEVFVASGDVAFSARICEVKEFPAHDGLTKRLPLTPGVTRSAASIPSMYGRSHASSTDNTFKNKLMKLR
jgi:hypothetical protein